MGYGCTTCIWRHNSTGRELRERNETQASHIGYLGDAFAITSGCVRRVSDGYRIAGTNTGAYVSRRTSSISRLSNKCRGFCLRGQLLCQLGSLLQPQLALWEPQWGRRLGQDISVIKHVLLAINRDRLFQPWRGEQRDYVIALIQQSLSAGTVQAPTALTCTIGATAVACSDVVDDIYLNSGDAIAYSVTPSGTPTALVVHYFI